MAGKVCPSDCHGATGRLISQGDNGNNVVQLLANFQVLPNGGNGFLRVLRFSEDLNHILVETYSPLLDKYLRDAGNQFEVDLVNGTFINPP